jgi:dTDP-4-amino-4,6-dideoxygalactose transaminase
MWHSSVDTLNALEVCPVIPIAQPLMGEEEKQAVLEVLDSGMLAQGTRVQAFEEAFAELCGVAHAVATSSGGTALHLPLSEEDLATIVSAVNGSMAAS